jgi:cell division protein FtsB
MKLAIVIILGVLLAFFAWQIYTLAARGNAIGADYGQLKAELDTAKKDNQGLSNDLHYYEDPANLEKEVRARFNYRKQGEKMIVIVPSASSSPSSSQP